MFAHRPLGIGKVILTELPVLTTPTILPNVFQTSGFASDASTAPRADKYERMFEPLSPAGKRELIDVAWGERLEMRFCTKPSSIRSQSLFFFQLRNLAGQTSVRFMVA
jgi:hypothetical protein